MLSTQPGRVREITGQAVDRPFPPDKLFFLSQISNSHTLPFIHAFYANCTLREAFFSPGRAENLDKRHEETLRLMKRNYLPVILA